MTPSQKILNKVGLKDQEEEVELPAKQGNDTPENSRRSFFKKSSSFNCHYQSLKWPLVRNPLFFTNVSFLSGICTLCDKTKKVFLFKIYQQTKK